MAAKPFAFRLRLGSLLFSVGLFAFCAVLLTQREPWRPLPGGGEVRLVKVAYGETLEISDGGLKADDLRDWLGPTWSRLLGPYPNSSGTRFGEPTLAFAFCTRGLNGNLVLQNAQCEIDMPDGQMLVGRFGGGGGVTGGTMTESGTFEITPFSERRLRMRLQVDGQILHFDVRNPIFRNKGAAWKAVPLPQTHTVDGIEITLDRVVGEWAEDDSRSSSAWVARADFSVGIDGKAAGDWVDCAPTFSDPLGNESSLAVLFSQPVWKVHCNAWKNERFPFPDSQVTWLGPVTLPGAGEIRVITPTPRLLAVLGPGHYRVDAGMITAIPAPESAANASPIRFYYPYTTGNIGGSEYVELDVDGIKLLRMSGPRGLGGGGEGEGATHLLMRDDFGQRLLLKSAHQVGETALLVAPIAPGTRNVEVGRVTVPVVEMDFFIPAPSPPIPKRTLPH
jgi:hypothetical protein